MKKSRNLHTFARVISDEEKRDIGKRIERARVEAGLTQRKMAELLHVDPRTYWNYENGRVPWALLKDIARETGVQQQWLMHGDDGPDLTAILTRIETELHEIRERVDQVIGVTEDDGQIVPPLGDAPHPPSDEAPDEPESPAAETG